jgi:hypothetical protein
VRLNFTPPELLDMVAARTYDENTINSSSQIIDTNVTFYVNDSDDFDTGNITVTYSSGGDSGDQLDVDIAVSIGSITSDGADGSDLVIELDNSADELSIEEVIENITYQYTSDDPPLNRTVSITVTDAGGNTSDAHTVTITVNPENDDPSITEGASIDITLDEDNSPTPFSLTLNAIDPDNDTITWSISSVATHGTAGASETGTSKSISYTPDANYFGSDSFEVQIDDGNGGTDTITVNLTINSVNDAPVITEGATTSETVNEDNTLNFTLNATDVENDTIEWSISTNGINGSASTSGKRYK